MGRRADDCQLSRPRPGGRIGHRLIAQVGTSALRGLRRIGTAAVLATDHRSAPRMARSCVVLIGMCVMCQYAVIEAGSTNNPVSASAAGLFSGHGGSLPGLIPGTGAGGASGLGPRLLDAGGAVLLAVPGAGGADPQAPPAPLHPAARAAFLLRRVPLSLITIAVAGLLIGSFSWSGAALRRRAWA